MKSHVYNHGGFTRKFNHNLFDIVIIQLSGGVVFFPFLFLVSFRKFSIMTPNMLIPRLTEIIPET